MEKIKTIFEREHKYVIPKFVVRPGAPVATEKIDGTNVRVTIRNDASGWIGASYAHAVRLEKRRNPTKEMKRDGIVTPWYVDAHPDDPADRYIYEALAWVPLLDMPEGEWSGEAVGPKIQGNPLALNDHRIYFFDRDRIPNSVCVPLLKDVPVCPEGSVDDAMVFYEACQIYLARTKSRINPDVPIEGIVWGSGSLGGKLKRKDFPE